MLPAKNKYADSKSSAYLRTYLRVPPTCTYTWYLPTRTYVAENKEVPDSNIGVPPVRKYANYRSLAKGKSYSIKFWSACVDHSLCASLFSTPLETDLNQIFNK